MKLKTRITWICCLSVLLAMICMNLLIWKLQQENLVNEAQKQALDNSYVLFDNFEKNFSFFTQEKRELTDEQVRYFFKARNDDYDVCMSYDRNKPDDLQEKNAHFVYNHTIFTEKELLNLDYKYQTSDIERAELEYDGGMYIVCKKKIYEGFILFHIEDINYVGDKLDSLKIFMIIITGVVLLGTFFLVFLVMNHTLKSLQKLDMTAEEIANGNYEKRVDIKGNDEIAKLGNTFNQMADAVEVRTKTLEDSERQKTMFMANLTHELKTPLAAISGYAQTLLTVKVDEDDREEALITINEECKRLSQLARKMMRLMELDSDEELVRENVSAKDLFDKTKRICRDMLKAKNLSLECQYGKEMFYVDEDLMLEVLVNLTENAIKASSPGQKIILSAKDDSIRVCDFGCGIPKEEQEKILEPFYMIDKSRSRKNGGAGLGLALTALILKRHSIQLIIESQVGKGTCMILQFIYNSMNT